MYDKEAFTLARNKYPEITEQRILDTATRLFLEKGWEETTVQNIIDELGDLTRGAFYHHYKSKDEIIDAVTTRMFNKDNMFEVVKKEKGLNGFEKLKKVLQLSVINEEQLQFAKSLPSVFSSHIFVSKQLRDCVNSVAPKLKIFFDEGLDDGSITVQYPNQVAETFSILLTLWFNPILFPVSKDDYMQKYDYLKYLLDNIGLPVFDNELRGKAERAFDNI